MWLGEYLDYEDKYEKHFHFPQIFRELLFTSSVL